MTDTPTRADLIERLTYWAYWAQFGYGVEATRTMLDAAAALTADAERIAALEEALHPFARAKHIVATVEADGTIRCILTYAPDADQTFTLASLDAARAALKGTDNDPTQIKGQEA